MGVAFPHDRSLLLGHMLAQGILIIDGDQEEFYTTCMLLSLQTDNFRMLAANHVSLGPMHLLLGQNGTGKSTFLEAIRLLSSLQKDLGVLRVLEELAPSFFDLCFDPERPIAFAAEIAVPQGEQDPARLRYELELGIHPMGRGRVQVLRENLFLLPPAAASAGHITGEGAQTGRTLIHDQPPRGWLRLVSKTAEGEDRFRDENTGDVTPFYQGPDRTALSTVPGYADRFLLAKGARDFLRNGIRFMALSPESLRKPARPGLGADLDGDGANLPFVARDLQQRDPVLYEHWVRHVGLAISGLFALEVYERPEDKHLLMRARFRGAHEAPVPSWLLSEGTLRVMALSLLTFAARPKESLLYLIEEVENGLHPLAMQAVYEAISSPPDDVQVLCSTHSPILLGFGSLDQVLLFRRSEAGTTLLCHGQDDEELVAWMRRASLADLFARGVL